MSPLQMGRALFGITMGFHAIFATLGVGIPLVISLAELIGIMRKDDDLLLLARRWTKGFVVLVAVGVVTGTIVGFTLSLLWPQFMKSFAPAIALPFLIEVFAFFFEAVFLAVYVYAWDKFKSRWRHWLCSLPIVIGAGASGVLITTANSFMNTPAGFRFVNGRVTDVHPLAAMANPAAPTETLHVLVSAYLAGAFVLAAVPAWQLLRGQAYPYFRKALRLTLSVALVTGFLTPLIGDAAGKFLAIYQPEKLAAGEALFHTTKAAPLVIGGIVHGSTQSVSGGIVIPHGLSLLAHTSWNAPVTGLDAFPRWTWPPLFIHYFFDGMVGIGFFLLAIAFIGTVAYARRWQSWRLWQGWRRRLLLGLIVASGPLSMTAIELGWMYDEMGRQPWIVVGYMLVSQAFTHSLFIQPLFFAYMTLYTLIAVATIWILRSYFRRHPLTSDPHWTHRGDDTQAEVSGHDTTPVGA